MLLGTPLAWLLARERMPAGAAVGTLLDLPLHPVLIGTAFVLNLWAENLLNNVRLVDVLPLWTVMVLLALLGAVGLVFAGEPQGHEPFRPDASFYYLTGIADGPGAMVWRPR